MMRILFISLCLLAAPAAAAVKIQDVKVNGQEAWLVEDHSLPLVTVKVAYPQSGAAYDPAGKEGLAFFVSQILDEGAGDMDSLAFHRALEDTAAHFDVETGEDDFVVSLQTLSQFKKETLHLLTLAVTQPRFDAEAVTRVRAGVLNDLQQIEEDPGYIASRDWKEKAFPQHPYQHPRHGTTASLGAIARADLQAFAKAHLHCGGNFIVVVGDMSAQEVKDWLAAMPADHCAESALSMNDITITGRAEPYRVPLDVPQTVVEAGLPAIGHSDPRYYALSVLNYIMGGDALTSRLGREIRDKRGLAYTVESHIEELDRTAYIALHFATRTAEADKALGVFRDVLAALAHDGVTQAEVDDAKSYMTGSFPLQIDSQGSLAEYLVSMWKRGLSPDYLEKRNALINAVTLQQVNDAAHIFLTPPPLIVMVGHAP